ncbi:Uncharacterised protein [Actinobaculum suis]|uniref:Uncharacterized protein n=1 Tax=Actinobaculum suis TaxID=1657 RepID=A0A7Z8Y8P9_9ACTO|nr:Uncharacterised protein [Actinobaculum suis]
MEAKPRNVAENSRCVSNGETNLAPNIQMARFALLLRGQTERISPVRGNFSYRRWLSPSFVRRKQHLSRYGAGPAARNHATYGRARRLGAPR